MKIPSPIPYSIVDPLGIEPRPKACKALVLAVITIGPYQDFLAQILQINLEEVILFVA